MQDDIHDGLAWFIEEGITDPERVCVVGGSFGGYAALMGAVKSPDAFRCAVSFAGVSDIEMLLKESKRYSNRKVVEKQIGDLKKDRNRLRATSPRLHAEKIQIPIMLAHGSEDRVVPIEQSEVMAKALDKAGKSFNFLVFDDGDHYLSKEEYRVRLFRMMDIFLARHLKKASNPSETPLSSAESAE